MCIRDSAETAAYDYDAFTADDVRHALRQERKSLRDFQALLSPAAMPFLEEIAQQAQACLLYTSRCV